MLLAIPLEPSLLKGDTMTSDKIRHYADKLDPTRRATVEGLPRTVLAQLRGEGWPSPYVVQIRL